MSALPSLSIPKRPTPIEAVPESPTVYSPILPSLPNSSNNNKSPRISGVAITPLYNHPRIRMPSSKPPKSGRHFHVGMFALPPIQKDDTVLPSPLTRIPEDDAQKMFGTRYEDDSEADNSYENIIPNEEFSLFIGKPNYVQ